MRLTGPLTTPVICAILAGGAGWAAMKYGGRYGFEISLNLAIVGGVALFAALMALVLHFSVYRALKITEKRFKAMSEFEAETGRMIGEAHRRNDAAHRGRTLSRPAAEPEVEHDEDVAVARLQAARHSIIADANVIPFSAAVKAANVEADAAERQMALPRSSNPASEAAFVEAWMQPVLTMPGRQVRYFEAIAFRDQARMSANEINDPQISMAMLVECVRLARSFERDGAGYGLLWSLSPDLLTNDEQFRALDDLLGANSSVAHRLCGALSVRAYLRLPPDALDRMHDLRERGFRFALREISDTARLPALVGNALFSTAILDAHIILNGNSGAGAGPVGDLSHEGVEIIATGIEREETALQLIDNEVLLGQGPLFSLPKRMRNADRLADRPTDRMGGEGEPGSQNGI